MANPNILAIGHQVELNHKPQMVQVILPITVYLIKPKIGCNNQRMLTQIFIRLIFK